MKKLLFSIVFLVGLALAGGVYFAPKGDGTLKVLCAPVAKGGSWIADVLIRPWSEDIAAKLDRGTVWASYECNYFWWRQLYSLEWINNQTGEGAQAPAAHQPNPTVVKKDTHAASQ